MEDIKKQVLAAFEYLIEAGKLNAGQLMVLGCSTSEITGGHIGKAGSPALGQLVAEGALEACNTHGISLAVQCCEHLNRALVMERSAALSRGYAPVNAVPHPTAGGSCASAAYRMLTDPVLVESIQADAGIDIGHTLIGMHLKPVAVPIRPPKQTIGLSPLVMAASRPKYIGGQRARYSIEEIK